MEVQFSKYQGAGNDFILIDDRSELFDIGDEKLIRFLCDRRFGIGADGLMLLRQSDHFDFKMVYFNSDGREGSMCGNGGRCIVAFARDMAVIDGKTVFDAVDGKHEAAIEEHKNQYWVALGMTDVTHIEAIGDAAYLNTGSPHYVLASNNINELDVVSEGRKVRYNERFAQEGTNVNFLQVTAKDRIAVRTYERGVEDETLACGTGVTAAAIYAHYKRMIDGNQVLIDALGGQLKVRFDFSSGNYTHVVLEGPAKFVFKGVIHV